MLMQGSEIAMLSLHGAMHTKTVDDTNPALLITRNIP